MGLPAFTQHLGCLGNQTSDEQREEIKTALGDSQVAAAREGWSIRGLWSQICISLGFTTFQNKQIKATAKWEASP